MKKSPVLLLILCCLMPGMFLAQDTLLLNTLKAHRHAMLLESGHLTGPGADFLQKEGAGSQFVLIGEDHGMAEIPQFAAALFHQLSREGYRYFATETGPFTAAMLEEMARKPDFLAQLRDTLLKYPFSIPFYGWREEAGMLQKIVDQTNETSPVVWGLDQEFAGSPRMYLNKLAALPSGTKEKEVVQTYADNAEEGFRQTIETRNPAPMFFYSVDRKDFAVIREAIGEVAEGQRLLDELEESWEIYHKYFSREGYASNRRRAELMKRHFWEYYQNAKKGDPLPKVLLKFGANHTYRGANGLNVFDIGNFVNELASLEGTRSLHLYVIGRQGTQNAYNPFTDVSAKKKPYKAEDYLDKIDLKPVLELSGEESWSVFDLRPLRHLLFNKKIRDLNPALEKVIWSYDAFVVIPEVHASLDITDK